MLNLGRGREGGCHKAGRKGETGPERLAAAFATDPQRGAMDHRGGMEGQSEGEVSVGFESFPCGISEECQHLAALPSLDPILRLLEMSPKRLDP